MMDAVEVDISSLTNLAFENALSAPSKESEAKRLLDAMLLAAPR